MPAPEPTDWRTLEMRRLIRESERELDAYPRGRLPRYIANPEQYV